ncbi:hypothetical protein BLNAU_12901 [Blattamonas nauphoetae]|uniref:Uncharacterized protein n=1 Tax=Blattamonas nauphoetae TaxID=2049346 RepID=A0ABQ9XIE5_9EUKA|nr:hypothetical protein BLNAU_12901 [Blattamonas nauphoetae]
MPSTDENTASVTVTVEDVEPFPKNNEDPFWNQLENVFGHLKTNPPLPPPFRAQLSNQFLATHTSIIPSLFPTAFQRPANQIQPKPSPQLSSKSMSPVPLAATYDSTGNQATFIFPNSSQLRTLIFHKTLDLIQFDPNHQPNREPSPLIETDSTSNNTFHTSIDTPITPPHRIRLSFFFPPKSSTAFNLPPFRSFLSGLSPSSRTQIFKLHSVIFPILPSPCLLNTVTLPHPFFAEPGTVQVQISTHEQLLFDMSLVSIVFSLLGDFCSSVRQAAALSLGELTLWFGLDWMKHVVLPLIVNMATGTSITLQDVALCAIDILCECVPHQTLVDDLLPIPIHLVTSSIPTVRIHAIHTITRISLLLPFFTTEPFDSADISPDISQPPEPLTQNSEQAGESKPQLQKVNEVQLLIISTLDERVKEENDGGARDAAQDSLLNGIGKRMKINQRTELWKEYSLFGFGE